MQAPDTGLAPGSQLGRYLLVRQLGAGGFGAVWEATHVDLKKRVVIKTLHPKLAQNADLRARFLREGEAASRIHHPHIVEMFDVGVDQGLPFLVMEFLEGETLASLIAREAPLPVMRIVDLMVPVIAAVLAAHREGIIHRDLKPENIFLAVTFIGEIQPKVLDFGISKMSGGPEGMSITSTSAVMGTPYYMSPEQAGGTKNVDPRADQYSLGVILYECATKRKPFEGENLYALITKIV